MVTELKNGNTTITANKDIAGNIYYDSATGKYYKCMAYFKTVAIDTDNPISFITNDDMGSKVYSSATAAFLKRKETSVGFQKTPYLMDDYTIGLENIKENTNVYITRGTASAFERHNILGEVKTFQDLENYRNDLFGLTETN